jgi:hypothetical protein
MTTAWIDLDGFKTRTVMPPEDVDRLDTQYPGFVAQRIATNQAMIETRLAKRYSIPFVAPVPEAAVRWLVDLTTVDVYQRRGWQASAQAENQALLDAATTAKAEIKEAADSNEGLFDLPLRADLPSTSGVSKGGPFGYSEASPYAWTDCQIEAVRNGG